MQGWAQQNQSLLQRLEDMLLHKKDQAQEESLWNIIAEACSSEWVKARKSLDRSDAALKDALSDENIPLGSIGYALDGGDTIRLMNSHSEALAHFALVEENLRRQPETSELMKAVTKALRIIAQSEHASRLAEIANKKFSKALKTAKPVPRRSLSSSFDDSGAQRLGGLMPFDLLQGGLRSLISLCRAAEPAMSPDTKPDVKISEANSTTLSRKKIHKPVF